MHIGALRAAFEITTVSPLIAKNATQALGPRCSILLLMSWRVQFDIYVRSLWMQMSLCPKMEMHALVI